MEIVPPPAPPEPPTPPPTGNKSITCEFCRCRLTPNGEYLALSEEARKYRDQAEEIKGLRADLASAAERITCTEKERDDARAQLEPARPPAAKGPFGQ